LLIAKSALLRGTPLELIRMKISAAVSTSRSSARPMILDLGVLDALQSGQVCLEEPAVDLGVPFQILAGERKRRPGVEELADVRDPLRVLGDDGSEGGELLRHRV
jgi:hypothetical protein